MNRYGPPTPEGYDPTNGTSIDPNTGFRVNPDGSIYEWKDTGNGYEIKVDANGDPVVDRNRGARGSYITRTIKTPAHVGSSLPGDESKPAVYGPNQYIQVPTGAGTGGRGGGGGRVTTANQAADNALAQAKFDYQREQDAADRERQLGNDALALEHQKQADALAQKYYDLAQQTQQGNLALNTQQQAFNQAESRRKMIIDLAQNPESYLASAFAGAKTPLPGGNDLFDLLKQLNPAYDTTAQPLDPTKPLTLPQVQPAAPLAGATPAASTATTAMYPPGYEMQNPNVAEQLSKWQAARIAAGQDSNDTAAFREHVIALGAPAFDIQAKGGGAIAPLETKAAATAVAPLTGAQPAAAAGATASAAQPLTPDNSIGHPAAPLMGAQPSLPSWQALKDTGFVPPRVVVGATPLGAPGRPSGGISPFIIRPQGGMARVSLQTLGAMNPEDALALGQTYKNTGNRALLADMLRRPGARALVR